METASSRLIMTIVRLRSQRSTNTPATEPKAMLGRMLATSIALTARVDSVSSYTASGSEIYSIQLPIYEIKPANHSREKLRWRSSDHIKCCFLVESVLVALTSSAVAYMFKFEWSELLDSFLVKQIVRIGAMQNRAGFRFLAEQHLRSECAVDHCPDDRRSPVL